MQDPSLVYASEELPPPGFLRVSPSCSSVALGLGEQVQLPDQTEDEAEGENFTAWRHVSGWIAQLHMRDQSNLLKVGQLTC
jgi:hypothetical protein